MRKVLSSLLAVTSIFVLTACKEKQVEEDLSSKAFEELKDNLGAEGFSTPELLDRSTVSEMSAEYVKVSTAMEFMDAIRSNKEENGKTIKVIEITKDLDLGYYELSEDVVAKYLNKGLVDFNRGKLAVQSSLVQKTGISQIEISDYDGLTIFSREGVKIRHAGLKITRCKNLVFRNLEFDEMWEWEDTFTDSRGTVQQGKIGDYDRYGWAFFKINFSENIWIDHCTFGKSFDGQIDAANETKGLHISWSDFKGGSIEEDSYITTMMNDIKSHYELRLKIKDGLVDAPVNYDENKNLYYAALRDYGLSHEMILEGVAMPQKKGFLIGDSDDVNNSQWETNKTMTFSIANSVFKNWQDRLPRIRGGTAYVYNSIIDSEVFYNAKINIEDSAQFAQLKSYLDTKGWKLALTSQAMLPTNDGVCKYHNVIVKGVREVIKINNKNVSDPTYTGKFEVENSRYILGRTKFTGSSSDAGTKFVNSNSARLKEFAWHSGSAPFDIANIDLDTLPTTLNNPYFGVGTRNAKWDYNNWLKVAY